MDVLGVETGGALCDVQGWQKDLVSGKIARIASARSAYGCLPAGGDWWVHPKVLAKVAETLAVDTRTLDQMKVLRMGMKMIDGKTRNVLRFDFVHAQSRHVLAYELETGALVFKAAAAQGPKDRFGKGNTLIMQMWLVEQRQVKPPWAGLTIHEGLVKDWALHYDATFTTLVPAARSELTLPLSIDSKVTAADKTWFTYDQVSQLGALRGLPAPAPETARLVCGTSQTDPIWIPPAALKGLRAGLVIDRDEKVNEKVSVKSADASSVVLLYEDEAGASERTYDAASGLMTAFKAAGGPGDLAKSVIQGRLTKGALGAPRAADERPASAPVATGESPDSVARAVLVAYRAKDVNALAQLAIDENRKMLDEMAEQGMKHPRYKSLFGDNWRMQAVAAWDERTLTVRLPAPTQAWVAFLEESKAARVIVVALIREGSGPWRFSDINSVNAAEFAKASAPVAAPNRPNGRTRAHEALRLQAEASSTESDYAHLDELLAAVRRKVQTRPSYTREQAVAVMRAIDKVLVDDYGFYFQPDMRLLAMALSPRKPGPELPGLQIRPALKERLLRDKPQTVRCSECATNSLLYLGLADELNLPLVAVSGPGHMFVRWMLAEDQYFNWETTGGDVMTDDDYKRQFRIADEAIKAGVYMKALSRDQAMAIAINGRAIVRQLAGKHADAIADLNKVIDLYPQCSMAYRNRGVSWIWLNEPDKALADYSRAIELDPGDGEAADNRAAVWMNKGEWDKALADSNRAIELVPANPRAYLNRGVTYINKKAYDRALTDLNKGIELAPTFVKLYETRAWLFDQVGQNDKAQADRDTVRRLQGSR